MIRAGTAALRIAAAVAVLCGCASTVDKANKIAVGGQAAFSQRGVHVTRVDPAFKIVGTSVLQDQNGAAVVLDIRFGGRAPSTGAPIFLNVLARNGTSVFTNTTAGIEPSLAHLPLVSPGERFLWVNDQVQPSGKPTKALARIGPGLPVTSPPPRLQIGPVTLTEDPTSGAEASGKVHNASAITQAHLVVFAVARRGGRVVAAGRAILTRVPPQKSVPFHVFFIGDPRGAQLSVSAPPTSLR